MVHPKKAINPVDRLNKKISKMGSAALAIIAPTTL